MAAGERRWCLWPGLIMLIMLGMLIMAIGGGRPALAGPPDAVERERPARKAARESVRAPAVSADAFEFERPDPDHLRLTWQPASVIWPLAPLGSGEGRHEQLAARLEQLAAMLEGRQAVPSVRGVIELDRQHAAGVWIGALETVRVRQLSGATPLRFIRGVDGNAAVIERGRALAPGPRGERRWELHQPPSTGAVWSIEADERTRIQIERVVPRSPRYVAVELELELLEWIAGGLPDADMPALLEPSDHLPGRLRLDAALARELLAVNEAGLRESPLRKRKRKRATRKLSDAIEAWRGLAAMAAIDHERPPVRPYFARDQERARPIALDDTKKVRLAADDSRRYRLAEHPRAWDLTRKGPGQLRIAARTWAPAGEPLAHAELRVFAGGRVIARIPLSDHPAQHSVDPDTALPRLEPLVTTSGEPVGEFAQATIMLAPGREDYVIELVGGPALLAIEGIERIEATAAAVRGLTPRKRAHAAERALARSASPAADWLELLLAAQTYAPLPMTIADPRFDSLARQSPLLAAAGLAIAAADQRLGPEAIAAQVARVQPWLEALDGDPSIDPAVRGELRTRWLAVVVAQRAGARHPELGAALVTNSIAGHDPITELPVEGLRLLAELIGPSHAAIRSPALAVLELARGKAPGDDALRGQIIRMWTGASRWSTRRPMPAASIVEDDPEYGFRPAGEWLVPRESMPSDPVKRGDWLRLEIGRSTRLIAELGDNAPPSSAGRRMRLLDVHVATPLGEREPVRLRVDDRSWWSPQLSGVQRHRFTVGPGVHELEVDGPPGTIAWAELPLAEGEPEPAPERLGRLEQMWPLADSVWRLPGPPVPGFVRLELRWPEGATPGPVRIRVHETGASEPVVRTVLFDPRTASGPGIAIESDALPLDGSPRATARHDIVLPIAASTTHIHFTVERDRPLDEDPGAPPIAASLSLRRGMLFSDFAPSRRFADDDPDNVLGGLAALDHDALLVELARLSRLLLDDPGDLDARARRAGLLVMVGETGHARADLVQLASWADHQGGRGARAKAKRNRAAALLAELEQRFDALTAPREITVHDPDRVAQVALVEPAVTAIVGDDRAALDPWLDTWAFIREAEYEPSLARVELELREFGELRAQAPATPAIDDRLLLGALTRAHLIGTQPALARKAGREWLAVYGRLQGSPGAVREPIAVGLASVEPLLRHLDDPLSDARDAGLALGLAHELEPVYGHTSIRQLAFVAALRSDWSRLSHSSNNAGFERLELPVAELAPSPSAEIREALLVAPWSSGESEQLRPGRKGVLAWDASPGTVTAELWCRATRPDLAPGRATLAANPKALGAAKLSVRLRRSGRRPTVVEREIEVHDGELAAIELPLDRGGRHQLELTLADDPIWLCSWRTQTAPPAGAAGDAPNEQVVEARRRALWWTASSQRGVELIVLGPASVHIEARAIASADPAAQPRELSASIERLDFDHVLPAEVARTDAGTLALAGGVELPVITESRRQFTVSEATGHTLLLTEAVPHRIVLRTDRGRALIRARLRRDRGDIPPPAQISIRELALDEDELIEDFDWRAVGPSQPVLALDRVVPGRNRIGTLDARVTAGLDDLADVDDLDPRFGLVASLGWRRELVRNALWLGIAGETRLRQQTTPAGGGSLRLGARIPVLGVRTGATVHVLAQSFDRQAETSVRLYAFVDRPIWLGPRAQLRPGLTVGLRWQSLDPTQVAAAETPLEPHPRIYLRYLHDHPVMLRPELELRLFPFQDMVLFTQGQLVTNSDVQSIDHVNAEIGMAGIARRPRPWVPLWGWSYQASPRFVDAHRDEFFVRHRVEAQLGVAVWARDAARVAFGVTNQLFISSVAPIRDVIELWIRVDASFGRRMRDYGPNELWFREPWAPRSWADDDHQAPSTGTPRRR